MTYMMEDSRTIPSVLTALFCARSIERIGDRCQNICEFIFYYVKGQDFRHVGGDELDKLLAGKRPERVTLTVGQIRLLRRIWQSARSYIVTGLINFLPEILPHKLTSKLSPVQCKYIISFGLFYF